MTEKIRIDQIMIGERRRKLFSTIRMLELAESIKQSGLLQPIIIDQNNLLVVGERRIKAHQLLGLEEIEFIRKEALDEWTRKTMELEENTKREDLTWQEVTAAELELHELYQEKFGVKESSGEHGGKRGREGWGVEDTEELLGGSHGMISQDLRLARAMREQPELELEKKETKKMALKALSVGGELDLKRELAEIMSTISESQGEKAVEIICGDSREVLKQFESDSFDFCVTDPQYGIGVHDMQDTFPNRGEVRQGIEFDDSQPVLQSVVLPVMKEVFRLLKEGSHCYVWFAIARYTEVRRLLEEAGFWVCHTPLIWIKNNALNLRPWIGYPVNYEPLFYCSKGYPPRSLSSIQRLSTFDHPILSGQTKVHPTEKPLLIFKQLIENCSQPKERGIDPFLGGGTFTLACSRTDRRAVGVEIDLVWALESKMKLEGEKGK